MRRILKDNCNTCLLSFLTECFSNFLTFQMSKIFLSTFFGFIVFPHRKNAINPSIAWIVKQVYAGLNFFNTILAKAFLSLTWFKEDGKKISHATPELLQIGFFSHINGFGIPMNINEVNHSNHPIKKFETWKDNTPDLSYSKWIAFLRDSSPKGFPWHAKWFLVKFIRKHHNYKVDVHLIDLGWNECLLQKLVWLQDELEGKEKIYHASTHYIRWNQISVIPEVTVKPINRAEIKRLKRKEKQAKKCAIRLA